MQTPTPTAELAFAEMQPLFMEVVRQMNMCPINPKQMGAFHIYVAGFFMGAACEAVQKGNEQYKDMPLHELVKEITGVMEQVMLNGYKKSLN